MTESVDDYGTRHTRIAEVKGEPEDGRKLRVAFQKEISIRRDDEVVPWLMAKGSLREI